MTQANPWQTIASLNIYDNPWISVREDSVIRPDGAPGIYGVVEFKNRAVGVVPVTPEGDTFLVGQYRYPLALYSWEIPEGGSPPTESVLESAKRELREETGLSAESWTCLGELQLSNSVTNEVGCVFLAEGLTQGLAEPEGTERLALKRLPLESAYRMAMSGEISDALAVIGLARAYHYLKSDRKEAAQAPSFPELGAR